MAPEEIKKLRQLLGWSQERFARELGVSFCTVNRWERGKTEPSPMAIKFLKKFKEKTAVKNTRNTPRVDLRVPINVHKTEAREKEPTGFISYTENLSTGGVMFSTPYELKTGEKLRVALLLETNGAKRPVDAVTEVMWTHSKENGQTVGVRFEELKPTDVSTIMNTMLVN
ncbi:helix-turn-helix domain-containing protein [bacterium]|nr:MAG: helix-turn-helix domain-containing protein [bacterium]